MIKSIIKILTLSLIWILFSPTLTGQNDPYRNKNWNPKKGKYYFSKQLTFSYQNIGPNRIDTLANSIFSVYVDEPSGTFLFTKESYKLSGEMIDFIIAYPNGKYLFCYTDEFGKKSNVTLTNEKYSSTLEAKGLIDTSFVEYTSEIENYVTNKPGFVSQNVKCYSVFLEKMFSSDFNKVCLQPSSYSLLPLYLFNTLDSETKLPYVPAFYHIIPSDFLIINESSKSNNHTFDFTLIDSSPTEYFIDLTDYIQKPKKKIKNKADN